MPPNLTAGWIALDKYAQEKPQMVQKTLNALYGALAFMRANKDATVKLIAELYEIPAEIAALEYENTIMKLETDGSMGAPNIAGAAAARARPGQARRHEGPGAGGGDHLDRSSSRFRPSSEAAAMTSALGVKAARIAIVVALFALWEMLSRTGIVNPRLLPSASDTLVTLWRSAAAGQRAQAISPSPRPRC